MKFKFLVIYLLILGWSVDSQTSPDLHRMSNGATSLMWALRSNNDFSSIQELVKKGADLNAVDSRGYTPLMYACGYFMNFEENPDRVEPRLQVIKYLVESGAKVNTKDESGFTAIMHLVSLGRSHNVLEISRVSSRRIDHNIVDFLIANGADTHQVTTPPGSRYPILNLACEARQNYLVIKSLINSGADVNAIGEGGLTALHYAARFCEPTVLISLIQSGAKINAKDKNGTTPLMVAASNRNSEAVKVLLNYGADPSLINMNGKDALYIAENPVHYSPLELPIEPDPKTISQFTNVSKEKFEIPAIVYRYYQLISEKKLDLAYDIWHKKTQFNSFKEMYSSVYSAEPIFSKINSHWDWDFVVLLRFEDGSKRFYRVNIKFNNDKLFSTSSQEIKPENEAYGSYELR